MATHEALVEICVRGDVERLRGILAGDPNAIRRDALSADLISAALRHIDSEILKVLKAVVDRSAVDAIVRREIPLIDLLLESGGDPNGATAGDMPPVHVATQMPTILLLERLVRAGADLERTDSLGEFPIDQADYDFVRAWLRRRLKRRE